MTMLIGCFYIWCLQASLSLPGSPFTIRRSSKSSQFNWRPGSKHYHHHGHRTSASGDRQPLVLPYLDIYNLNLPYADDSNAVTPTSDELCNSQNTHGFLAGRRRLSSTASYGSRISHPSYGYIDGTKFIPGSRRSSFASHYSRHSYTSYGDYSFKIKDRQHREPTHFQWNTSMKNRAAHPLLPEVVVDKTKSDDNVSNPTSQSGGGGVDPGFPVGWGRQPYILHFGPWGRTPLPNPGGGEEHPGFHVGWVHQPYILVHEEGRGYRPEIFLCTSAIAGADSGFLRVGAPVRYLILQNFLKNCLRKKNI